MDRHCGWCGVTRGGDGRSAAVRSAKAGTEAWRAAARQQLPAQLDHADLYDLGDELAFTLSALQIVMCDLAARAGVYANDIPAGHRLFDDTRTVDPRARLAEAAAALRSAVHPLRSVSVEVTLF